MALEGNSHREKDTRHPVTRPTDAKKQTADGKREKKEGFLANLLREDGDNIKEYLFETIVIPGILDAIGGVGGIILDSITDTLEIIFEKKGLSANTKRSTHTNYNKISSGRGSKSSRRYRKDDDDDDYVEDDTHSYDNVRVRTEREAKDVIAELRKRISDTGYATVADLYKAVNDYHSWNDSERGWTSLNSASYVCTRNSKKPWLLILPQPRDIRDLK